MQRAVQLILYAVGLPLELLVIAAMVRARAWRELPFVVAYSVAVFLASVVELWAFLARLTGGRRPRTLAFYYWVNEGVLDALIFLAVISLIYRATAALRSRTLVRRGLVAGTILFASASFAIHYDPTAVVGEWMTLVSRDFSLCAAILDLALWIILLAFRRGDYRLLLLSGGLGIQFTGEAIGHSVRSMPSLPYPIVLAAGIFVSLTSLACLYIWWQTFRRIAPALSDTRAPRHE